MKLTTTKISHTTYEIGQFYNYHFFTKSKTVFLGNKFEHHVNKGQSFHVLVHDTFEYISVKETLQVLYRNSDYVNHLNVNNRSSTNIYSCFQDEKLYKSNKLIKSKDGTVILLQLFYDGKRTMNAMKSNSVL